MVKTRHSGDVDLETPPRFISLNNEKNRQSTRNSDAIENNLSHVYGNQNDLYNIFDDKVVESRLRPRIGPSRTYNYIDVDSSDEDSLQRQSHLVFTRSRQIKQEMLSKHVLRGSIRSSSSFREEDADQFVDDDDDNIIQKRTSSVRHKESTDSKENLKDGNVIVRKKKYPSKHHPDEDISRGKISSRLSRGSEDDDDETGNFIRRSSRTRRQVYDTLNQSFLVSIPGQKKQTTEDNDHSDTKDDSEDNQEFSDMYSRVKRKRVRVKRNMYGMPVTEDSDSSPDIRKQNKNNSKDDEFESESQEGDAEDGMDGIEKDDFNNTSRRVTRKQNLPVKKIQPTIVKSYSLREHKPRTDLYKAPLEERKVKKMHSSIFIGTPVKKNVSQTYHSPAQRRNIRKRSAFHSSSSSTSSSSDGESSDEKSFKRCKTKSMAKARSRLMPMNYSTNALPPNIVKDRIRSGSSLADVEPMKIDKNITFSSIGGLGKHIQALKEMVVFPLLYDKVFQRFNVDPPRGVLFYGPPGTGKTLVARALANECSKGDRRVAFFMRKGADCLSKWVGESERQLRILFDQAYKFRPSIIFFDEIDGLAPVRSSRQDQIHSSIVSTLLALMDGLDNRGEIVVIGATNRIDSLDPALRRPGRFDREFFFPLPSFEARKQILKIHTDSWTPKLNDNFISELAEKCVGYCGADLKSLCTEAAMLALRRRYPQIYVTNEALQIDVTSINISARDFFDAVNNIIPTAQRSVNTPTRALPPRVQPLLLRQLNNAINTLKDIFPPCMTQTTSSLDATAATPGQTQLLAANSSVWDDLISDEDDNSPSIFVQPVSSKGKSLKKSIDENTGTSLKAVYLNFTRPATRYPSTFRPRLMLVGKSGQGQTTYIAPAIIHKMENLPIHVLDLPALYAVTAKTPEESCANVFLEARRKCPSIIYLPYINQWWDVMADTLKATLLTLIHDLNPSLPLLLLATSEQPYEDLDSVLQELFNHSSGEIIEMDDPNKEERRIYFRDLLLDQACKPPPQNRKAGSMLEFVAEHDKADSQLFHQTQSKRGQKRKSVSPLHSTCSSKKANDTICKMNTSENIPLDSITNLKEVPFSTHGMKLRPRINVVKLNRNHSAKELKNVSDCIALNSKACDSLNNQNSLRTHGLNEYPQHIKNVEWNRHLKSARKGSFVSPRHERYVHRLLKLEKNLLKLGTQFFLPSSFSPTVHKDSQDQCCSSMNINEDCTLSCGSSQLLYKKSDSKNKIISDTDEINIDYFLPMNIKDLETFSVRNSNSTQATQSMDEIAYNNNESLVKQTRCYNLRNNCHKKNALKMLEVLPKAAPLKPSELTKQELEQLVEKEELTLMELRIFLRDVLNKLGSDKKFSIFAKPVNIENAPDYYEIIEHPMDLSTMMGKIDLHEYGTVKAFMNDIDLICSNALEYNPNRGPMDRIIRHRACALKDTAYAIIKTELDKDFEKTCVEIEESRKRRGHKSSTVPNFYFTKPQSQQPSGSKSQSVTPNYPENPKLARSIPKPEGERFSRRVRGLNTDPVPPLEAVEKVFKLSKSSTSSAIDENKDNQSNSKDSSNVSKKESTNLMNDPSSSLNQGTNSTNTVQSKGEQILENSELAKDSKSQPSSSASKLKKKNKLNNIWCKPRRKRTKFMLKTEQSPQEAEMDVDEMEQCQDSKSNTEISHCHSSQQLSQQLRIETTENDTSEPKEEKFTTSGKSVRLKSPQISPTRVITRRSSMSPTNITLKSTEPSSSSQVQDKLTDLLKKDSTSYFCDQTKQSENKCNTELRKHGVTSETAEKPSAAKRLDLDSVVLDSGVGSSLDSNGDSRDSSDHSKTELSSKQAVITSVLDDNQNCNSELTSSVHALTDQSKKEVIIDKHRLASLLNVLVLNTEGFNVEKLEKIYSQFSHIIYNHRHNYNRNEMIVDLERKLEELVKVKISGPSSSFKK